MKKITIEKVHGLDDYRLETALISTINQLQEVTENNKAKFDDRTIWMINSTAQGGGVAEMLPSQMNILRSMGVSVEWLVMEADDPDFFVFTKQIHNAIHGKGDPEYFNKKNKELYEGINANNVEDALKLIKDGDIVVIHDPQPAAMGNMIAEKRDVTLIWRCHIGLELRNEATNAAWDFLAPYLQAYQHYVYSVPEYIPEQIDKAKVAIIPPSIDTYSYKNRELNVHKNVGILHQAGIIDGIEELVYPFYSHLVKRIQPDGTSGSCTSPSDLELLHRPVITQVSRWDYLKGFVPLMEGFVGMKEVGNRLPKDSYEYRWISKCRLVLAGPDLDSIQDDPEGLEVMETIIARYKSIHPDLQKDIAILLLPMNSAKENALIVNALQRTSNIVVQNSLQEGFGLTATEAMWKAVPMVVSGATGLRSQVEDGIQGLINPNPDDPKSVRDVLMEILKDPDRREEMGMNGRNRVIQEFNIVRQLIRWVELWAKLL